MNYEDLFKRIKNISTQVDMLSGFVQNPYLPEEINPVEFRERVNQCITDIQTWERDVSQYYRNMSDSQKNEINKYRKRLTDI